MAAPTQYTDYGAPLSGKGDAKAFDETNKFRRKVGMTVLRKKMRNCLKCGKEFESIGNNNRLCGCVREESPL